MPPSARISGHILGTSLYCKKSAQPRASPLHSYIATSDTKIAYEVALCLNWMRLPPPFNFFCFFFFLQFHYLSANKRILEECFIRRCTESLTLPSASTLLECRNISVQQLLICIIISVGNAKKQHTVMQKMPTGEY